MSMWLLMCTSGFSQDVPKKAQKYFNAANYDIGLNQYETAKEKLLLAIKAYPDYLQARLFLADIYYQADSYEEAMEQYQWVRSTGSHPARVELFMARSEFQLQHFDRTVELIDEYLLNQKISKNARLNAELLKSNAIFSKKAYANALEFHPTNLGGSVNSSDHEYMPSLNADETTVIFTRLIRQQEDLYITGVDEGIWRQAVPIDEGPINTGHNEGAHCISADGKTLLFTICNEQTTWGSCDLYISKKGKKDWSPPKNIGAPLSSVSWDSQPSLSADGQSIYFVSNRKGGYGGFDIFVSHFNGESWGTPINLGPDINTAYDEQTPFLHFDGQTLYFSSNGHPGMGKQDIFFSRNINGEWTTPINLGYPINTAALESGLNISLDGRKAYYAAERIDGFGGLDLYEFEVPEFARPKRVTYVRARIVDSQTGKPVNAEFILQNLTTATSSNSILNTAKDGEFLICLPSGSDYSLHIKDEGYVFESLNFSLKDTVIREAYVLSIKIDPVETGKKVVLRNVFFETDSYDLLPASTGELLELVKLLETYDEVKLEISGHTDNTGDRDYNMKLSLERAQSVVDYLIQKGISRERLIAKGYGPDNGIADNDTKEGRSENRRTEFVILP